MTKAHWVSIAVGALGTLGAGASIAVSAAPCLEQAAPAYAPLFALAAAIASAAGPIFAVLTPKGTGVSR